MIRPRRFPLLIAMLCLVGLAGCQTTTPVLKDRGLRAYKVGDIQRSEQNLQRVIQRDPTDLASQYTLGLIALEYERPDIARTHFEIAYTLAQKGRGESDPTIADIIDGLSEAMFQQGEYAQLVGFLESTLERGTVRDYLRLADLYRRMGDPDNAMVTYRKAVRHAPNDARPYIEMAEFYDDLGERKEAVRQLRIAYYLDPNYEGLADRLRSYGVPPGPTAGIAP